MRILLILTLLTCSIISPVFSQAYWPVVNSVFDEQAPALSPDGNLLVFSRAHHPTNIGGTKDRGDIWISEKDAAGNWSEPRNAGAVLNSKGTDSPIGFLADNRTLYFQRHFGQDLSFPDLAGIFKTVKTPTGWSKPERVVIPGYINRSIYQSGHITPDERVMVLSLDSYGSIGNEDIYVILRQADGSWSAPRNVGLQINTVYQEFSPYLSDDKRDIYFATNGRGGFGSFDILVARRLDDSWTQWSAPKNLGNDINTTGRELYYKYLEHLGLAIYTSTINSDGYGDIRFQDFRPNLDSLFDDQPQPIVAAPPAPVVVEVVEEDEEEEVLDIYMDEEMPVYLLKVEGRVFDGQSKAPMQALLTLRNKTGGPEIKINTRQDNGIYEVVLKEQAFYELKAEASGYMAQHQTIDAFTHFGPTLELNFTLEPIEVGKTIQLPNVLFRQGTAELLQESFPELDIVVEFLKDNPSVEIELAGHTDNRGIPRLNVKLSQDRVDMVKEYLVSKGISGKRITGTGYGGAKPIASNVSEETRRLNRRVEFTVTKYQENK
jgi:OmpA-OmpF porin, OOP family